jgi:hypothetical protein
MTCYDTKATNFCLSVTPGWTSCKWFKRLPCCSYTTFANVYIYRAQPIQLTQFRLNNSTHTVVFHTSLFYYSPKVDTPGRNAKLGKGKNRTSRLHTTVFCGNCRRKTEIPGCWLLYTSRTPQRDFCQLRFYLILNIWHGWRLIYVANVTPNVYFYFYCFFSPLNFWLNGLIW